MNMIINSAVATRVTHKCDDTNFVKIRVADVVADKLSRRTKEEVEKVQRMVVENSKEEVKGE
jgi:hypothetical protein